MVKTVEVNLGPRSYQIIIGRGVLAKLKGLLSKLKLGQVAIVVTNSTINRLYGSAMQARLRKSGLELYIEEVPDSETSKSFQECFNLIERFAKIDQGKGVLVIAFGGGVIGDLAGFAAAIYKRGVPYIQIPTTLLAQIDSSIGGKVALDLPFGKNLVGSFYQPRLVLSDINFLRTLDSLQIKSALAETIKYAVISDKQLFVYLEKNFKQILRQEPTALQRVIEACCRIKAGIVQVDERERKGVRTILNFGHTTAHALEAASGYARDYPHGYAVALGMLVACEIARRLKIVSSHTVQRISSLIAAAGLSTEIQLLKLSSILKALAYDKKFSQGKNCFVLPVAIGKVIVKRDIPARIISAAIKSRMVRPGITSLTDYE